MLIGRVVVVVVVGLDVVVDSLVVVVDIVVVVVVVVVDSLVPKRMLAAAVDHNTGLNIEMAFVHCSIVHSLENIVVVAVHSLEQQLHPTHFVNLSLHHHYW